MPAVPRDGDRTRMARLPRVAGASNPCPGLLDRELAGRGHPVEDAPAFTVRWLWRARRSVGFLHFHWRPDLYYALIRREGPPPRLQGLRSWLRLPGFAWRLGVARRLGYRVIWTIHEVYPPENARRPPGAISRRLDRVAGHLLARSSDLLLAHDEPVARRARVELALGARRVEIVPHGSYTGVYPPGRSRAEVRAALGIAPGAFAFLSFGQMRRDKAIEVLVEAFAGLSEPDVLLLVAGRIEDARTGELLTAAAARDPRIVLRLGTVPDAEVAELHAAADAAVLARDREWTSGSAILALSLGVPVVASRLEVHRELLGDAGWLFAPGDAGALRAALRAAAAEPEAARARGIAAERRAAELPSWAAVAERVAALIAQPPRRG
jgi:beta-1,4-mannosyltransferase